MTNTDIRKLAISLLDDEHGINENAWQELRYALLATNPIHQDILDAVEGCEGRYFLHEGIAEELRQATPKETPILPTERVVYVEPYVDRMSGAIDEAEREQHERAKQGIFG